MENKEMNEQLSYANNALDLEIALMVKYRSFIDQLVTALDTGNEFLKDATVFNNTYGTDIILPHGEMSKLVLESYLYLNTLMEFLNKNIGTLQMFNECKDEFLKYLAEQREKEEVQLENGEN